MNNQTLGLAEQLYLNLACKPFTFILGNSQVDMTCLTRGFAAYFGATEENGRYLQLAVRPDWMDSSDLIGWLNLEGKFIPGVMMDFLKTAKEDPEHAYFVCLDRIILSRAEYYLRDLLNAMDSRGEEAPKPYVPAVYYGRDEEAHAKYGVIPALQNLFIMGTVNLDETSLPLNQRFLDRVHTMSVTETVAPEIPANMPCRIHTLYYGLDQAQDLEGYFDTFEEINKILIKATSYLGFKVRNDAILYLLHNRAEKLLPEQVAMDQMMCQKILPRMQGSVKLLGSVMEDLLAYCEEHGYVRTAEKLTRMIARSKETGYASCWE